MWGRKRKAAEALTPEAASPGPLKEAVRKTRIEIAEKSSVVVDLRDAERARLELLNDALDPLFHETPPDGDLFDRGIRRGGQTPGGLRRERRGPRRRRRPRALNRRHRPCGDGARQAALPVRAGHPLRPKSAGGIKR